MNYGQNLIVVYSLFSVILGGLTAYTVWGRR